MEQDATNSKFNPQEFQLRHIRAILGPLGEVALRAAKTDETTSEDQILELIAKTTQELLAWHLTDVRRQACIARLNAIDNYHWRPGEVDEGEYARAQQSRLLDALVESQDRQVHPNNQ